MALGALLFGALIGSFLNVVIARLPRRESVVSPGSRCQACGSAIRWHDNIPILSFLWLKGRCRDCRAPISWRYPLIEGVTGGLFALAGWQIGWRIDLIPALLFVAALIAVTAIDLQHQIIPDRITLPGIGAGFLAALITHRVSWADSLIGIVLGGGIFFAIIVLSGGGMGGGDMKLGAMIGAFLGWKLTLLGLFVAVLLGGLSAVVLLAARLRGRKDPVPFGPFLATGALVSLFWGERILRWYLAGFAE
jgi:leader peptidase (prepilin peptidase)/N-methyltransferase